MCHWIHMFYIHIKFQIITRHNSSLDVTNSQFFSNMLTWIRKIVVKECQKICMQIVEIYSSIVMLEDACRLRESYERKIKW